MERKTSPNHQHAGSAEDQSTSFLLAEFNQAGEFWRQTIDRIATALNFYLTAAAILVSALLLLFQSSKDLKLLIIGLTSACVVLLVSGTFLATTIIGANRRRAEYRLTLNLVRRYFVDQDPKLGKYLALPIAALPGEQTSSTPEPFLVNNRLLFFVNVANSILVGAITASLLWLLTPLGIPSLIWIGAAVSVIALFMLFVFVQRAAKEPGRRTR